MPHKHCLAIYSPQSLKIIYYRSSLRTIYSPQALWKWQELQGLHFFLVPHMIIYYPPPDWRSWGACRLYKSLQSYILFLQFCWCERCSWGTQTPHPWGQGRGSRPSQSIQQRIGSTTPLYQLHADEEPHTSASRRAQNPNWEAPRHRTWTCAELNTWNTLDDPGNYDNSDPYYRPDEGGDGYQGNNY